MKQYDGRELVKVYIAGPLTSSGNRLKNIDNALAAANAVLSLGFLPFVPHLNWLWERRLPPRPGFDWVEEWDLCWLKQCDALVRLPGYSKGAAREVEFAQEHGIPVVGGVLELIDLDLFPDRLSGEACAGTSTLGETDG